MAGQRIKVTVGLFVVCGMGLALMAVIWLGMSQFFQVGRYYAVYFNESVQGLSKDSPVKYRGVAIGRVESISVAPDSKLIQVVLKIDADHRLDQEIVAQLKSVGITGSMFVELDRKKPDEPDWTPPLSFPSRYPMLASKPSDISALLQGINDILSEIKAINVPAIAEKLAKLLDRGVLLMDEANIDHLSGEIETLVKGGQQILDHRKWDRILVKADNSAATLEKLLANSDQAIQRIDATVKNIDLLVTDKQSSIKTAVEEFRSALQSTSRFMDKGGDFFARSEASVDQLKNQLVILLQELNQTADKLNHLMENLADQPSQLLYGPPPPEHDFSGDPQDTER